MKWDPVQYQLFTGSRLQPGLDLISRLSLFRPRTIADLGCGTGNLTSVLATTWPEAEIEGVDASPEMLEKAKRIRLPTLSWRQADIAAWEPEGDPPDLIFSNAALHWLGGHRSLFPRLMRLLAPGGVLAVQMPRNFQAPSHRLLREVAADGGWRRPVAVPEEPVLAMEAYYGVLAPEAAQVDLWQTDYLHVLDGEQPVLEWMRGTSLVPVMAALDADEQPAFLDRLGRLLAEAYPRRPDGRTLFRFRRLFLIARR